MISQERSRQLVLASLINIVIPERQGVVMAEHFNKIIKKQISRWNVENYPSKVNQGTLSEKCGVRQDTFSRWMRGRNAPPVHALRVLADFFDINIESFFEDNLGKDKTIELHPEKDAILPNSPKVIPDKFNSLLLESQKREEILLKRLDKLDEKLRLNENNLQEKALSLQERTRQLDMASEKTKGVIKDNSSVHEQLRTLEADTKIEYRELRAENKELRAEIKELRLHYRDDLENLRKHQQQEIEGIRNYCFEQEKIVRNFVHNELKHIRDNVRSLSGKFDQLTADVDDVGKNFGLQISTAATMSNFNSHEIKRIMMSLGNLATKFNETDFSINDKLSEFYAENLKKLQEWYDNHQKEREKQAKKSIGSVYNPDDTYSKDDDTEN